MLLPMQPVVNPAIPFVDKFGTQLQPGNMIIINGSSPLTADSFVINFALGDNFEEDNPDRSPVAFHFNPRFEDGYAARNTFQYGWGLEESASPNSVFPFQKGQRFEIMILVTEESYMVAVNGKHYIGYNHRIPYREVTTLHVLRDVDVERIMLVDGPFTAPAMPAQKSETAGRMVYDLVVPFETEIPGGQMQVGSTIYLSGRPNPTADRFNIDLFFGGEYGREGDVAFHLSVRFPERAVIRNTKISGCWGEEERDIFQFLFEQNVIFDMKIVCDDDKFNVFVGGQYICAYMHRLAYSQVDRFRVEGDVFVRSLMIR